MDAIELLKKDHAYIQRLFNRFDRAGRNSFDKKFKLYDAIRSELEMHSHVEEEFFYPVIKEVGQEGKKLIGDAMKQLKELHVLIGQIDRLAPSDPNFDDRVQSLIEHVERHIEEDEREIFQFVRENCSMKQLEDIGRSIEDVTRDMRNARRRAA